MPREAGKVGTHEIPCLRGLDRELRAKRLIAARRYKPHSLPRFAILLGHWDRGSIVSLALAAKEHKAKPKRKRKTKP